MKTIQLSIIEELYRIPNIEKQLIKSLEKTSRTISFILGVISFQLIDSKKYSPMKGLKHTLEDSLLYNEKLREFLCSEVGDGFVRIEEPMYPSYGVNIPLLQLRAQINSLFNEYRLYFDILSKAKEQGTPERILYSKCMRSIGNCRDIVNNITKHVV